MQVEEGMELCDEVLSALSLSICKSIEDETDVDLIQRDPTKLFECMFVASKWNCSKACGVTAHGCGCDVGGQLEDAVSHGCLAS